MFSMHRLKTIALLLALACVAGCAKQQQTASPKDLIAAAWINYSLGEFDQAIMKFDAALAQTEPNSELQLQTLYGLATTWNLRRPGEDPDLARELYLKIIAAAPEHDLAAWSQLGLARMIHLVPVGDEPDYGQVLKAYQDVIDKYPHHLAGTEAFIYKMSILVSTLDEKKTRQAVAEIEEFVKHPENTFIGPAWSLLAVAYTTLNQPEKRLDAETQSLKTTEVDPTNPFTEFAWQYWNLATIAEFECGDFDTARIYYNRLITEYPTDIRVYGAQQALVRMDGVEAKIRKEM